MDPNRLSGKVALVTGIGNGIGQAIALAFARQGAKVVGCDIDAHAASVTASTAQAEGLSLHSLHPLDLTAEGGAVRFVEHAVALHGGVDILVNAAAFARFAYIEDMSYADWQHTLKGELDIVFLACQAVWPHLVRRGAGAILNFASVNAYMALQGSAALAHCAGKGGVLAMTRQLAMEGGPYKIRCNTISPGFILTAATRSHLQAEPGLFEKILDKKMLKRAGQPDEVAMLASFLVSDEAGWITASDYAIDGGARGW